jgi:hypothetical protein
MLSNPATVLRKARRFRKFIRLAEDGKLLQRPAVKPRWGPAHFTYHPPMYGVLQGSYDDVEFELNEMRKRHLDKKFLFVGGDGLSILRMNHLLAEHPDLYIDQSPMIIPVQGESPHGVYHMMHGGWRLYLRLIRQAADQLGMGDWLKDDPLVKHFNSHLYMLWKLTRAFSEYITILSRTPGAISLDLLANYQAAAEKNIDFAWVFHFLHDYAFLVLDFKQSVRAGESANLDELWSEFFSLGHTGTANKTQYVPMSIMRVWWSEALSPQLAALYHSIRSIPMSLAEGRMVGWDFPCEDLNCELTQGVLNATEGRIDDAVARHSFTAHNYRQLRGAFGLLHAEWAHNMKDMDADVRKLVQWCLDSIGPTWQQATRQNAQSQLGITRGLAPWDEVHRTMSRAGADSVPVFVAKHARNLTRGFYQFSA